MRRGHEGMRILSRSINFLLVLALISPSLCSATLAPEKAEFVTQMRAPAAESGCDHESTPVPVEPHSSKAPKCCDNFHHQDAAMATAQHVAVSDSNLYELSANIPVIPS